jgi:hypothetical protein
MTLVCIDRAAEIHRFDGTLVRILRCFVRGARIIAETPVARPREGSGKECSKRFCMYRKRPHDERRADLQWGGFK